MYHRRVLAPVGKGARHQGELFKMQYKLSHNLRPLMFNAVLWVVGVTLLFMARNAIERLTGPVEETWLDLDLAVMLGAYVLFFLLEPIRNSISRRLRKYLRR